MPKTKFQFLSTAFLAFAVASLANLSIPSSKFSELLNFNDQAQAKSSGGRSGGGSFKSSPSNSGSRPSNSSPSNSSPSNSGNNNNNNSSPSRPYNGGGTTIVPIIIPGGGGQPVYNNGNGFTSEQQRQQADSSGAGWIVFLFLLLIIGGVGAGLYFWMRSLSKGSSGEVGNDKVTVTKIQVALLAEARAIQAKLNDITLEADTNTPEGLSFLLQESVLALLRTPENWTHVLASSESMTKDKAEDAFSKISVTERSKFSSETLVNVGGRVRSQNSFAPDPNEDPAAYIVVTLIVGTEHDKPLFGEIKSREALQASLEKIAAVTPEYLMVFELLWSPQAENDSLTYDELLTEYTNMVQI